MENHHQFLFNAIAIFSSLSFAVILHTICKKIKITFSVGLLVGGFLLAKSVSSFGIGIFENFKFSPEIVFYVFLPTLIFESAYNLNFRQFRGVLGEVSLLSTFGLFVSMFIVAGIGSLFLNLPIGVLFLFGALI